MKTSEEVKSKPNTTTLLKRLIKSETLETFFSSQEDPELPAFHEYLQQLCKERGISAESIIRKADIDRTYGHQLFNGTRKPSRDKVLLLALALSFDLAETQRLLRIAGKSDLYPRVHRDAALIYAVSHHYDVQKTQETLYENGFTMLGKSRSYEDL